MGRERGRRRSGAMVVSPRTARRLARSVVLAVLAACAAETGDPPLEPDDMAFLPGGVCTPAADGVEGYDYLARQGDTELRVHYRSNAEGHKRLTVERRRSDFTRTVTYESPAERLIVTEREEGRLPRREEVTGSEAMGSPEAVRLGEVLSRTREICEGARR